MSNVLRYQRIKPKRRSNSANQRSGSTQDEERGERNACGSRPQRYRDEECSSRPTRSASKRLVHSSDVEPRRVERARWSPARHRPVGIGTDKILVRNHQDDNDEEQFVVCEFTVFDCYLFSTVIFITMILIYFLVTFLGEHEDEQERLIKWIRGAEILPDLDDEDA